ncbi:DUF3363 domain-containing protein [Caulobacter sp. KR2-114]|uniref:DUF3363 domain-containing protein n=1 Tax=Caulobacter sp. KR2-114 TaxID=3400912 RepID=UPI003BFB057B
MSADDEDFKLRIGRSRPDGRRPVGFAAKVRQLALREPANGGRSRGRFNRVGVGRAAARAQALTQSSQRGARRVMVKARVVKLLRGAAPGVHLRYLQRDGTTRDGGRGELYAAAEDHADGRAFLARGEGDPHQFRFIVSAEDGAELADLRAFTRDLMAQVERDLGVPLDWVAVDHFNTGHPHSHIVLRGRDLKGKPLFIAGDYIAHGLRGRASELVTLELGPETVADVRRRLESEIGQRRLTSLDRAMLRDTAAGLDPVDGRTPFDRTLRMGRLETLQRLGLAECDVGGGWTIRSDAESILRRLGERDDIIRSLHAAMRGAGGVSPEAVELHEGPPSHTVVGRLVGRRLSDDLGDRLAVIVEGLDGRTHHFNIDGDGEEIEGVPVGAIVSVGPPGPRPADRTIAERANAESGMYRPSQHLAARIAEGGPEPEAFVETHVRRLEALRRLGVVERIDSDTWSVPPDFLQRVQATEGQTSRRAIMRVLSLLDLDSQVAADGATWLDRQLLRGEAAFGDSRLAGEVHDGLRARADRLVATGDAERLESGELRFRPGLLARLQAREVQGAGARLASEVGLPFAALAPGEEVSGVYRRRVQLASGAFALVERSQDFLLVPWRPVIEPQLGGTVRGVGMTGGGFDWRLGRDRGPGI